MRKEGIIYFHSFDFGDEFFILQRTYCMGSQNFPAMNKVFDLQEFGFRYLPEMHFFG